MITPPCKDCKDRCIGCHGKCDKYQQYVLENNAFKESEAKRKDLERACSQIEYNSKHKRRNKY